MFVNRGKSIFAIIGLSVGVASVITMVAVGNGAKKETISQLEELGTNLITINAGKVKKVMKRKQKSDLVATLRMNDCETILSECLSVKEAVPSMDRMGKVKYGNTATISMINGVSASYFSVRNFTLQKGRLFSPDEDEQYRRVAVIGCQVCQNLFGSENPVGKTVMVGKVPFTIIGVLNCKGTTADGSNLDAQVLIPVRTALRRIFNVSYLKHIFVEVSGRDKMHEAENEIISVLRSNHRLDLRKKENDFTIDNQLTDIQVSESSARSFTWLIAGVAAVALLVGGIGILAVMLLSVRERNAEIGLRLSVGAKRRDILQQFIAESTALGLAGGICGFIISLIVSGIVGWFSHWQVAISPFSVGIALAFSLLTGMIFGVIPARKASQADPVSALTKE